VTTREQDNAAFVERFQRAAGLPVDGWAGAKTLARLGELLPIPKLPDFEEAAGAWHDEMAVLPLMKVFPGAKEANVRRYAPAVLRALGAAGLGDEPMVRMALATIRAETSGFVPISEGKSKYNTDPGAHPFNRYDNRGDIGNRGKPDGARYKGRGFVQLTGRANYRNIGQQIGIPLEQEPELANDPEVAAKILAAFLKGKEASIRRALEDGDLARARKLVNGGRHGLDNFTAAWKASEGLLA
jgi:peptidoglycan L-alanyl-D-glutamate endopeptidase CwlK